MKSWQISKGITSEMKIIKTWLHQLAIQISCANSDWCSIGHIRIYPNNANIICNWW